MEWCIIGLNFSARCNLRKDNKPYWLKLWFDSINNLYIDHFIRPQLDGSGLDFRVMGPRHLQISGPGITVADHVHMMALPDKPVRLAVYEGLGKISIGNYCIVNPGVRISSACEISIGHSCMLAMNAYLSDADWHDLQHRIYAPGTTGPIILGNNVWIGDSALVCKGVTIGDNSVVGAWSVVTRDVPANVVVAGVPAKVVRELDPDNLTTRQDLFNGPNPYESFEADYDRKRLDGNSILGWLKSIIKPGNSD
jgi:acetyltransferase-like isoleucine patch superfamily enzyme